MKLYWVLLSAKKFCRDFIFLVYFDKLGNFFARMKPILLTDMVFFSFTKIIQKQVDKLTESPCRRVIK